MKLLALALIGGILCLSVGPSLAGSPYAALRRYSAHRLAWGKRHEREVARAVRLLAAIKSGKLVGHATIRQYVAADSGPGSALHLEGNLGLYASEKSTFLVEGSDKQLREVTADDLFQKGIRTRKQIEDALRKTAELWAPVVQRIEREHPLQR